MFNWSNSDFIFVKNFIEKYFKPNMDENPLDKTLINREGISIPTDADM